MNLIVCLLQRIESRSTSWCIRTICCRPSTSAVGGSNTSRSSRSCSSLWTWLYALIALSISGKSLEHVLERHVPPTRDWALSARTSCCLFAFTIRTTKPKRRENRWDVCWTPDRCLEMNTLFRLFECRNSEPTSHNPSWTSYLILPLSVLSLLSTFRSIHGVYKQWRPRQHG